MGAVLAVVVDVVVCTIEAVTEAAAAAAAATAVEVTEDVVVAGEIAAEAAAEEAAAGVTAESIIQECLLSVEKFCEKIQEFLVIDAVFRLAKELLQKCFTSGTSEKLERLEKSLDIFHKVQQKMSDLSEWLKEHKDDIVVLDGYDVSLDSALLERVLKPLSVALGSLKRLTNDVSNLNANQQVISNAQIISFDRALIRIVATFHQLAEFKEEKSEVIPTLMSFPVTTEEVSEWRGELGFADDGGLSVLNSERYKYV